MHCQDGSEFGRSYHWQVVYLEFCQYLFLVLKIVRYQRICFDDALGQYKVGLENILNQTSASPPKRRAGNLRSRISYRSAVPRVVILAEFLEFGHCQTKTSDSLRTLWPQNTPPFAKNWRPCGPIKPGRIAPDILIRYAICVSLNLFLQIATKAAGSQVKLQFIGGRDGVAP